MDTIQPNTHSFVVKVWSEETGTATGTATPPASSPVVWRGQITHVPSGEQKSFHDLSEIATFVAPYLQQLGVKPSWWLRLRLRLLGWTAKRRAKRRAGRRGRELRLL